jgi:hypothetical protein
MNHAQFFIHIEVSKGNYIPVSSHWGLQGEALQHGCVFIERGPRANPLEAFAFELVSCPVLLLVPLAAVLHHVARGALLQDIIILDLAARILASHGIPPLLMPGLVLFLCLIGRLLGGHLKVQRKQGTLS